MADPGLSPGPVPRRRRKRRERTATAQSARAGSVTGAADGCRSPKRRGACGGTRLGPPPPQQQQQHQHQHQQQRRQCPATLPSLLQNRETGLDPGGGGPLSGGEGTRRRRWAAAILRRPLVPPVPPGPGPGPKAGLLRRRGWEWRPHARRSVPFTEMETPRADAVLALDRCGSYALALGGGGTRGGTRGAAGPPLLALRFYGLPSPAALGRRRRQRHLRGDGGSCGAPAVPASSFPPSPLLGAVPLLQDGGGDLDGGGDGPAPSPAAVHPVRVLLSADGALGAALVLHPPPPAAMRGAEEEALLGTVAVFDLPGGGCLGLDQGLDPDGAGRPARTLRCTNVRVGGALRSHTVRNLLWPVGGPPPGAGWGARTGVPPPSSRGYLLLNDEDDGYRLTWIFGPGGQAPGGGIPRGRSGLDGGAEREGWIVPAVPGVVSRVDGLDTAWESVRSDPRSGCAVGRKAQEDAEGPACQTSNLHVHHEAFFSVEALLSDVVARRRNLFPSREFPDYHYSLVSVQEDGRVLHLVVVCSVPGAPQRRAPASVGVLLEMDLERPAYVEREWVQHPSRSDLAFLRQWSSSLALQFRMRETRVGPFSTSGAASASPRLQQLAARSVTFHENNEAESALDDIDPNVWEAFTNEILRTGTTSARPKLVAPNVLAMSSLYPFCDVVSNKAVISASPVTTITCRNFPTELTYNL